MFNYFTDSNFNIGQLITIVILLLIIWLNITGAVDDHNINKSTLSDIAKIHKRISKVELYIASIVIVNLLKTVYGVANGK